MLAELDLVNQIKENYMRVVDRIEAVAGSVNRSVDEIKIVTVSKGQPLFKVEAAIKAGIKIFGENYPEEGIQKILSFRGTTDLEWHMIGHIQSRKAKLVSQNYDWVQSIDSLKLANRLDRFAGEMQRKLPVLLEFNISGESTKSGWPAWEESLWGEFLDDILRVASLPNLSIKGVMGIPPFEAQGEKARPYFQRLRKLRDYLLFKFADVEWNELSMGMSADYDIAVQEGATIVRIGTAIMGPRI